ncbi:MAG TPA: carboxypeptidase-like regulatory domain-containing protein [Vicinamibacterales bacterium]|nr:carboxypeptidase-like regulatory domain-containing protein [Vicinamibacterales bacterium]
MKTVLCASLCVMLAAASAAAQQQVIITRDPSIQRPGGRRMQPPREAKTGTARLRGRVVSADNGSPIRRAQVRISGGDLGRGQAALTDADGRYEFRDLPAGRFTLSVVKAGYVNMQYGQLRPFEPGKPIDVSDGQSIENANFVLPRGSVIAGRIVDEFGEPVADAMVSAMRSQFRPGGRRLVPAGRIAQTNDLGQFRIYGLPPGDYYVSATLRSFDTYFFNREDDGPTGSNPQSGYAPTYYPGTPSPAEAQRVQLALGQELASVDFALAPTRLSNVSGTVIGSDGKPASGAMVLLMPSRRQSIMFAGPGGTARTQADGRFTLHNVVPGDYVLQARNMSGTIVTESDGVVMGLAIRAEGDAETPRRREPEFASVPIAIGGSDIGNLVLVTSHGARASGRVIFEGEPMPSDVDDVRVMAPSADPEGTPVPGGRTARVTEQGTWNTSGLIGQRLFRVGSLPKGWVLKSVSVNGQDVTDTGFDFRPGADVSGIDIVVTSKTTHLSGSVVSDDRAPVKDYTVVVFPDDEQKWSLVSSRWIATARPDQEGRFDIRDLPPGGYYAIAVEYVPQGEWQDPEWLTRARAAATAFRLDEGETKTLDLTLSR